jgi:GNAT superfamily N-acetyltransferase
VQLSIRQLGVGDASLLVALRREALEAEPLAFAASTDDDIASMIESVRGFLGTPDTQAVYGAFKQSDLVGMVGLVKSAQLKQRHKAMIWGMYVQPKSRGTGIGRALLNAAIGHARAWPVEQLHLCVTETAQTARHLYESAGFRMWGTEPRALHWKGRFVSEHHLVLAFGTPG